MKLKGGVEFILSKVKALSLSLSRVVSRRPRFSVFGRSLRKPVIFVITVLLLLGTFFSTIVIPQIKTAHAAPGDFISIWDTTKTSGGSSANNQIHLPLEAAGTYDFVVDWGDLGPTSHITVWNQAVTTHTYAATGIYTLTITGTCTGWIFNNTGDRLKISQISQFGALRLGNSTGYFYGCTNLKITAVDVLDLTGTTTLSNAFRSSGIDTVPSMNSWDVSNITNMRAMFLGASLFTQNISSWDVSNVTEMSHMFNSTSFNQPIGNWDVSSVTSMTSMFYSDGVFNQPIGNWDVSNVTSMVQMFRLALNFNQPIGNWNVSKVTSMSQMFTYDRAFNKDISNWDTSNVTNMDAMFMCYSGQGTFNQPIGSWDVSKVTDMNTMFSGASLFNADLSSWDVSSVTNMSTMFATATTFNQDIGSWDVSNVTNMTNMFNGVTLSTINYSNLLLGWSARTLQNGVTFSGGSSKYYTGTPATARAHMTGVDGWIITDGGSEAPPVAAVPSAPTVNATSATSLTAIINPNGNPAVTEYAISCDTDATFLNYTTNACEAIADDTDHWRTYDNWYANWGGAGGFVDTGLSANTQHTYKVKARNTDHVETALSGPTSHYTLSDIPTLSSTACPSQTTYCLDTTPDITVTNALPLVTYRYLVDQTLAPDIAAVEAGTADADGLFTVPDGQIHPHATFYIHVIAQNLDGDFSTNYGTYKIISRDSSGAGESKEITTEPIVVDLSTITELPQTGADL